MWENMENSLTITLRHRFLAKSQYHRNEMIDTYSDSFHHDIHRHLTFIFHGLGRSLTLEIGNTFIGLRVSSVILIYGSYASRIEFMYS